jgi:hypothetical protein
MTTEYENGSLAQEYLKLIERRGVVSSKNERCARIISKNEGEIHAYYGQCRGLGKLQISGIGRETMRELDLILRKGVSGAERRLGEMYSRRVLEARL